MLNASPHAPAGITKRRALDAFELRFHAASRQSTTPAGTHETNGDEARYADKSGSYSKCLLQDRPGVVNADAFKILRRALGSSDGKIGPDLDFEALPKAGGRPLNGPLAAFAYTLIGGDSQQFGHFDAEGALIVPPPPRLASEEYATELVELYWASLLRDVAFTDYETNPVAIAAAAELNDMAAYQGPRDSSGAVTPLNLFRGGGVFADKAGIASAWFAGETVGPYMSQFAIVPTSLGTQPLDQRMNTCTPGIDFMKDLTSFALVQNGSPTGISFTLTGDFRIMHNGRSIAAFSHQDELYQAYFTAYLVLKTLNIRPNPGSPYVGFARQQPFGTFGSPDIASTLAAVARSALNAVWYQKWVVHLRHRPESGGGIVELMATGQGSTIDGHVSNTVMHSQALAASVSANGSHLLSQAFPEGSPAHPAYPTGHGTVAGACITILKFFFDGNAPIPSPMVPSSDGTLLQPYTGADAAEMTVNGELHKLAHNISFGHGIHGGIHWRSDTDFSIRLGEAVALSYLQDLAKTYAEKFAVTLTRVDGTPVTISN
jgi:hypothetical protein